MESYANLIFQAGANCRVIIKRRQLFIPKLTFNSEGQKLYMENYLKPYKWTYLNEVVEISNNTHQQTGHYTITTAISKPRHVFFFELPQQILETNKPIHFCTILLIYQTMLM